MDHHSPLIIQNGANQGIWDRSFEQSVLDQGVPYPADMSALPTSTPNPEKLRRRSSRRTWFDTTPADGKLEIAVEEPEIPKKKLKCHDREVLTLTHFSAAPRLDYGTVKLKQERMCVLLIRNPHDYEQKVHIEKVPEKKHFSVPMKEFVVGGGESFPLEITWAPVEHGNFREMIRMQVDSSYRLQAYVYGKVQSPQKKKRVRKTGLLASKVSAPFSVIHTNSLSNINRQYSPEKKPIDRIKGSDTQGLVKQKQKDNRRGSKGMPRRSPRLSNGKQQNCIEHNIVGDENIEPFIAPMTESSVVTEKSEIPQEVKSALPKPFIEEKLSRKKLRRSNTYSNVSGTGLTIPVIKGESVQGHRDTSLIKLDSCNISGIRPLEDSLVVDEQAQVQNKMDTMSSVTTTCVHPNTMTNLNADPSFLVAGDGSVNFENHPHGVSARSEEPSFLTDTNRARASIAAPSFLNSPADSAQNRDERNPVLAGLKTNASFQDSLECVQAIQSTQQTEFPSFLSQPDDKENVKLTKLRRSSRGKGAKLDREDSLPTERKLLRSLKRRSNKHIISPDSFVKETHSSVKKNIDNSHRPLNDSVGQSSILEQVRNIRAYIHEKSVELSGNESFITEANNLESECKKKRPSPKIPVQNTDETIRRETFLTKAENIKMLQTQKPSEASPRRTTFTVIKQTDKMKLPKRSRSEGSPSVAKPGREPNTFARQTVKQVKELDTLPEGNSQDVFEQESATSLTVASVNKDTGTKREQLYSVDSLENNSQGLTVASVKDDTETRRAPRFSADSLENDSQEEQFGSPGKLVEHPSDDFGRRATLTVTKSRPSDALLRYAKKSGVSKLLLQQQANKEETALIPIMKVDTCNEDSEFSSKSAQNSTFEVSRNHVSEAIDTSFPTTPNQLPSSPNPDLSRRSTHVVEKPQVLDLSRADRKQLFAQEISNDSYDAEKEAEEMIIDKNDEIKMETGNTTETEKKSMLTEDDANDIRIKKHPVEIQIIEKKVSNSQNASHESIQTPSSSLESDSPSMNARRKLSGRRSLTGIDRHSKQEPCVEKQEKGELFFVALDASVEKEAPVKKTTRKDPSQFLRKRSNPVTQSEDAKAKRPKNEVQTVKTNELLKTRARPLKPDNRAVQTDALSLTRTKIQPKPSRTVKNGSKDSGAGKEPRHVLKPKASLVRGLAQSKLILVKKTKSALAKHPLPFAAKNMYYDERWMEKQERGFVNWLNFILTPAEEYQGNNIKVKEASKGVNMREWVNSLANRVCLQERSDLDLLCLQRHLSVDAGKLVVDDGKKMMKLAPTNEVLSFRAYSAHRKLNRLRKSACRLFQSDMVIRVIQKLEAEVESRRLLVRKDKMLHADLGAKQKILDLLLCYNPLWLRIGLETIYGEVVPLQSNTDVYGLSRFILTRMLYSPDIAQQYAHPTVPNLYRDGYAEATAQHTLKKFLMLVFFLEKAKLERLIDHNPCLFCKDSDAKTSKDLLLHISRDFLSGEGDITRHLGYLGYKVSYTQTALDEFDFAVSKLSTDLRDGLRLSRVLELLCNKPDLSKSLRAPATSRLQKIHNVEAAFKILADQGVDTAGVTARDIVDGHREKTLRLLWTIILQYQVQALLDEAQLRDEVELLEKSLKLHNQLHCLLNYKSDSKYRRVSKEPELHTQNEKLDLLMKWCRCICAFYNIKIENFTVSFSDGRALCHILHYYHPGLLPLDKIHMDTAMTHMESLERNGRQDLSTSINDSMNSSAVFGDLEDPELLERLQNNEKENFKLLFEKVKELGGVPLMLKWSDMSGTIPDEKVVVTYLLYLCARLLDIRQESRAARVIQIAWRKHRLSKLKEEYKVKHKAAAVIQQAVRKFLVGRRKKLQQRAALCIQRVWRGHCGRREAKQRKLELDLRQQQEVIKVIQAHIRGYLQRRKFHQVLAAVLKIQNRVRSWLLGRKQRKMFLTQKRAACVIQATWKMYQQRKAYEQARKSVITVQTAVRCFLALTRYRKIRQAAVKLQHCYRMKRKTDEARKLYLQTRNAVIRLQAATRGCLVRRALKQSISAATLLQSVVRCHLERKRFLQLKLATVVIQRRYRANTQRDSCRQKFLTAKKAATTIQSVYRRHLVQKAINKKQEAATKIQAFIRGCMQQRKFYMLKRSVSVCQRAYRNQLLGRQVRNRYLIMIGAAITIQAVIKARQQRRKFLNIRAAVTKLQAWVRFYQQRNKYLQLKRSVLLCQRIYQQKLQGDRCRKQYLITRRAVIKVQGAVRGYLVRKTIKQHHKAATVIQASFRRYRVRERFLQVRQAAVLLQRHYRNKCKGSLVRKEFLATKTAAVAIQATLRGYLVRKGLKKEHAAVTRIQAFYRGNRQRQQYQKLKSTTIKCQKQFRNKILARECRKHYLIARGAAITIQASVRGYLTRRELERTTMAATLIQAQVRGYLERKKYQQKLNATRTLQKYFRSKQQGAKCRRHFLAMRNATVRLQAVIRGSKVRQDLRHQHRSATVIQSHVRGFLIRTRYQRLRMATITCQRLVRRCWEVQKCRQQYQVTRQAIVVIQSAVRGFLIRKEIQQKIKAAVLIQSHIRSYLARKGYQRLRQNVIMCQRLYRSSQATEKCRKEFLIAKGAVITVQALVRGYLTRREQKHNVKAATVIQARVRGYLERKKYLQKQRAARTLQKYVRAKQEGTKCRQHFLAIRNATVRLQAAIRGSKVRQALRHQHRSATVIQSHVRGFLMKTRYQRLRMATITCQRLVRRCWEVQKCRQQYQVTRQAIVVIQSAVRGFLIRKEIQQKIKAAVLIQSHIRSYIARKGYQRLRQNVIMCQRLYRSSQATEKCRKEFLIAKGAVITIQALFRGHLTRREQKHNVKAATVIQARVRGYLERKKYLQKQRAARTLQKYVRAKQEGTKCRQHFLAKRNATVRLQAAIRGSKVRQALRHQHRSATVIQSHVRGFLIRTRYQRLRMATITCQRLVRRCWEVQKCRQQYQVTRQAIVVIQSAVRGFLIRKEIQQKIKAAVLLQSHIRSYLARKGYQRLRQNVIMCQRLYRSSQATEKCRKEFLIAKGAVITIQAVFRGYLVRKELQQQQKAATLIQSKVRSYLAFGRYQSLRKATVVIQRHYRASVKGKQCRHSFVNLRTAVVTLQSAFRGFIVRRDVHHQHKSATIIQSCIRCFLVRRSFCRLKRAATVCQRQYRANKECQNCRHEFLISKGAAITLQAAVRGHLTRKGLKQKHRSATIIQSNVRGYLEKRNYLRLKQVTVLCQTLYRSNLAAKECRQTYEKTRKAAVTLQSVFRGYRERHELRQRQQAAVTIQSRFRGFQIRQQYCKLKHSAVTCQRLFRRKMEAQVCRRQYLVRKGAAITLQACIRGFLVRKLMKQMIAAATKIQAIVRGHVTRRRYLQLLQAVLVCQRRYRAQLEQKRCLQQYVAVRQAVVTLQSAFRGYLMRQQLKQCHLAATTIQASIRSFLQKQRYCQLKKAAICCQRYFRAKRIGEKCRAEYLSAQKAAVVLQAVWRGGKARQEMRLKHVSATSIQTLIRGYQARRRFLSLRQTVIVCQRSVRQKRRVLYLQRFAEAASQNLSAVVIQRCYRKYRITQLGKAKIHSVTVIQRWVRSKLQRLKYLRDRQRLINLQLQIRQWLCRRNRAAIIIQRATRKWLGTLGQKKTIRAATKIQALWRGHCTRKNSKSKKLTAARHRVQKATASATEDKKLCNRTTSALDFLLKYKQLSQVLDALVNLEVATRLSWVCCERLVEANAVTVLYRLVRGCNRSLPHMEIIKYTVSVMLNVAKYEQTRPYLHEEEDSIATLIELLSIYREKKGPIFTKTCNLLGIMALDENCKKKILQDSRLREKLLSIHNLTVRKHKMEENQRVTRAKMNATMNSTFTIRSPVKRHSIKPDWSLHKDKMSEIENPLKAINFVLVVVGLQAKCGRPIH